MTTDPQPAQYEEPGSYMRGWNAAHESMRASWTLNGVPAQAPTLQVLKECTNCLAFLEIGVPAYPSVGDAYGNTAGYAHLFCPEPAPIPAPALVPDPSWPPVEVASEYGLPYAAIVEGPRRRVTSLQNAMGARYAAETGRDVAEVIGRLDQTAYDVVHIPSTIGELFGACAMERHAMCAKINGPLVCTCECHDDEHGRADG